MALSVVIHTFQYPQPAFKAWKVFDRAYYAPSDLKWQFNAHKGFSLVERGKWLLAAETPVSVNENTHGHTYTSGFHSFLTEKAAKKYLTGLYVAERTAAVVPVIVRSITLIGRQFNQDVLVSQELYVSKEDEVLEAPEFPLYQITKFKKALFSAEEE